MTLVTTHYRYKRPPRKRKAVALEVPAIVTVAREKLGRVPGTEQRATVAPGSEAASKSVVVTPKRKVRPDNDTHPDSALLPTTGKQSVIVTPRSKRRPDASAMELPASRREPEPVEREGDDYKRLKAAMTRRLRGE